MPAITVTGLSGRRLELKPFVDARDQKELIGENREDADKGKLLPVSTRDDVAAFVTDRFRFIARYYGIDTSSDPGDVAIAGELRSFFVAEGDTYEGDVALKMRIVDKSGKLIWEGVTAGAEHRWGRSYKADNYYETLSDSLINAVHKLLANAEFMAALRGTK